MGQINNYMKNAIIESIMFTESAILVNTKEGKQLLVSAVANSDDFYHPRIMAVTNEGHKPLEIEEKENNNGDSLP